MFESEDCLRLQTYGSAANRKQTMEMSPVTTLQYSHAFSTHSSRRCQIHGVPFMHNLLFSTGEILKACVCSWEAIIPGPRSDFRSLFLPPFLPHANPQIHLPMLNIRCEKASASRRMLDITVISNLINEPAKFKETNIASVNKTLTVQCLPIFIAYRREVSLPRKKNTLWSIICSWWICSTLDLYHYSILVGGFVRLWLSHSMLCQWSNRTFFNGTSPDSERSTHT